MKTILHTDQSPEQQQEFSDALNGLRPNHVFYEDECWEVAGQRPAPEGLTYFDLRRLPPGYCN